MKFLITYELRAEGSSFSGEFEFEAEQEPETANLLVRETALQDSIKFQKSGQGGLSILAILPILS